MRVQWTETGEGHTSGVHYKAMIGMCDCLIDSSGLYRVVFDLGNITCVTHGGFGNKVKSSKAKCKQIAGEINKRIALS
ncbi:MAG: hypothetical protein DRO11_03135 [Methanobacteriota archaeon]|nr:MAG: hypothetical protein DRO11_03135 [Euryarchaeota archaeon]